MYNMEYITFIYFNIAEINESIPSPYAELSHVVSALNNEF